MRSLRLRIFLTVWPLVVLALVTVALQFGRWVEVEVDRIERTPATDPWAARRAVWARELATRWDTAAPALARLQADVRAVDGSARLVALDTAGRPHATTGAAPPGEELLWRGDGRLEQRRRVRDGGAVRVTTLGLLGTPVTSPAGTPLGYLYVITDPRGPAGDEASPLAALASSARHMLWMTVALASLVAAAAALLLARPIVAQVRRLADATARLRAGALDTRVAVTSRDELGELEGAFDEMARSLERAELTKRRMISDVSHELRTPLTNVIGLLEAMRDGLRPPDAATLDAAREEALLLAALVGELQELSTAEAGAMRFELEALDAGTEACRAVEASRVPGGPRLEVAAAPAVLVRADRRRLAQVLRNLLRNAVAHTPATGTVRVEVARAAESGLVDIAVVDDGEGIPAEHLPLVWERFHRVDPSRSRGTGGTGLGLAVVRQLVAGMGGRVHAESVLGRGSRFVVTLPTA